MKPNVAGHADSDDAECILLFSRIILLPMSRISLILIPQFITGIDELSAEYRAVMPKEEDLHGAALALIRLQDTYNLNVSEMASGQISGTSGFIHMTGKCRSEQEMKVTSASC